MSKEKEMGVGQGIFVTDDPVFLWTFSDYFFILVKQSQFKRKL